jgi:hypothetical protein
MSGKVGQDVKPTEQDPLWQLIQGLSKKHGVDVTKLRKALRKYMRDAVRAERA